MENYKFFLMNNELVTAFFYCESHICNQAARIRVKTILS
jgi:hypothetical protein